jgi:predicted nucleic acid-binding protein
MDSVFLDTSVFVNENFFHGKKINSLLNLSEKNKIDLYITEITYNELISNFNKFLSLANGHHKRFIKESENWILRNDKDLERLFLKIDTKEKKDNFKKKLDDLIHRDIIKIIPYTKIDIKIVFDKYFKPDSPFGEGDKKSEFPDAFTLELINDFCTSNVITGIVFSTDNDFLSSKFSSLDIRKNYQDYLELKYTEIELVKKEITKRLFLSNIAEFEKNFVEWYKENLEDSSLYINAVNWKEVYDVKIDEVVVGSMDYTIIEIIDDVVTIEVNTSVKARVSVLTDDEQYMYYDSDDKSYHYYETNYESFEKEFDSSMIVFTEIFDEDDYSENFEIESINDGLDISFDIDYDY